MVGRGVAWRGAAWPSFLHGDATRLCVRRLVAVARTAVRYTASVATDSTPWHGCGGTSTNQNGPRAAPDHPGDNNPDREKWTWEGGRKELMRGRYGHWTHLSTHQLSGNSLGHVLPILCPTSLSLQGCHLATCLAMTCGGGPRSTNKSPSPALPLGSRPASPRTVETLTSQTASDERAGRCQCEGRLFNSHCCAAWDPRRK